MAALHPTTVFNVQASVNQWFRDRAASVTLPAVLSFTYTIADSWPQKSAVYPTISLSHAGISRQHAYMGQLAGSAELGLDAANLVDISVWVSKQTASGGDYPHWLAQHNILKGLVEEIFASPQGIVVKDYRTSVVSPSDTAYRIMTKQLNGGDQLQDPNPAIVHTRYTLRYEWVQRTNISV